MRPSKQPFPWSQNHHRQTIFYLCQGEGGYKIRQPSKASIVSKTPPPITIKARKQGFYLLLCQPQPANQRHPMCCAAILHACQCHVGAMPKLSQHPARYPCHQPYVTGGVTKPYMKTQGTNLMAPLSLFLSFIYQGLGNKTSNE